MTKKITFENALEILKNDTYNIRDDLKISNYSKDKYYCLSNGSILVVFDDATHAVLFDSENDFLIFLKKANATPSYMLDHFPNNEDDYFELVKYSKIMLEEKFKVKIKNYSYKFLNLFDLAIAESRTTREFYFSEVYYYLVPFATEVVIKENNGRLKLFYSARHDTVEPHILLNDKRVINVFIDLYDVPMENWSTFKIQNTVQLRLDKL